MKDFYKFIISALIVVSMVCLVDQVLGLVFEKYAVFVEEPKYKRIKESTEDVIVLGASRASNQYVTDIIREGLQMSSYNYGLGARNIYTNYAVLHLLLKTAVNKPKVVIWDFYYTDIMDSPGWNTEQLDGLWSAYNYDDTVREVVNLQGNKKSILLKTFRLYKFNSKLLKYFILPFRSDHNMDYFPLYVEHNSPIEVRYGDRTKLDSTKMEYIDKFISLCKDNNIKLFVFISPAYYKIAKVVDDDWSNIIKEKCEEEGIPFFNYEQDTLFLAHPEWFYNQTHLNDKGARIHTKRVVEDIKSTGLLDE